jgi:hypothetical protein
VVFCEGAVTERQYVIQLARSVRATSVKVATEHGDPKYLVELAVKHKRAGRKSAPADIVWCIFDADDHKRLNDALIQARDNDIPVALSNPCFELWALLHFADHRAYIDRAALRAEVQAHLPGYDKELPFDKLAPGKDAAADRAKSLGEMHIGNGSEKHENPSTNVWQIVEAIENLRTAP